MIFESTTLSIDVTGHVATLWLDRPDKLNAISFDMWGDFIRAMDVIAANEGEGQNADAFNASIIVGGQIGNSEPRLFLIYGRQLH